ncbi:MAG: F0F1 ATP synthase subunit epsilon [Alphaproteobacteria bacterium]
MQLVVVTPDRQVLDTEVEEVYAPGVAGQFGVLPKHVAFVTALVPGEVRYRERGADRFMAVSGGVCEVSGDTVTILADTAEAAGEIDAARASAAEKRAAERLARESWGTPEYEETVAAAARAVARRQVAARGK